MPGLRRREHAVQLDREVERAEALLIKLYGLRADEASVALVDEAAALGVSVHATALGVVANWAANAPALARIPHQR